MNQVSESFRKYKIIEIDADAVDQDLSEDASLYPYDPSQADIDIKEDPQSVFQFIRKYDSGKLIIDPDFQRNVVWKPEQKSKFIESIILNFPLPPIYVNQSIDGDFIIIDGLQRTTAMYEFYKNKYPLVGLEALPKLNGKYFEDLSELKTKIEDKKLLLYILKPSVPLKVVYDLFNRINTGGTPLNRQEVRNCIFKGKSTVLLKSLAESIYFTSAIDEGISPKRMKDREAVLRYISFRLLDYDNDYTGDMSAFLERAMKIINVLDNDKIEVLEKDFVRVMKATNSFFGKDNFRLSKTKGRGSVNMAILETVGYFFSTHDDAYLDLNRDKIVRNYSDLISDRQYIDAVRYTTGTKKRVKSRFDLALQILSKP
jgi:hypothetical protein